MRLQGSDALGDQDGSLAVTMETGRRCEHYVFGSSVAYTGGEIGGIAAADVLCQSHADSGSVTAPLNRTWRALLSDNGEVSGTLVNARDRVSYHTGA